MNSSRNNTFNKDYKLCSKTTIAELFQNGSVFFVYPFRVIYIPNNTDTNKYLITVPKRKFKRAVDRNAIKRLIREAIRLDLTERHNVCYNIVLQYTANTQLEYNKIKNSIHGIHKKISKQHHRN